MQRRNFIKTAALSAIAISATGFVRFNGERYEGDCATTSDVLGLFYRPDSPLRKNLIIKGRKGNPVELLGRVLHKDCTTPYKNTKIERWHCNGEGVYDNETTDFKYQVPPVWLPLRHSPSPRNCVVRRYYICVICEPQKTGRWKRLNW